MAKRRTGKRSSSSTFSKAIFNLKTLKAKDRRNAMSMANNRFIRQFCTEVKKLRNKKLSPKTFKNLKRHSKQIRKLIHSKTNMKSKRKMLSQRGGFLPFLLAALAPAVGSLVGSIFKRR